jgi:outer membrane protein OmpA-like peptidoglycan-associated protein
LRFCLPFVFTIGILFNGNCQDIQWATTLEYQFNQFGADDYGARQVLDKPDAFPPGDLNTHAFRLKTERTRGSLIVGFKNPQFVETVLIVENNDPGRTTEISLIDEAGNKYLIHKTEPQKLDDKFRTFSFTIPRTSFKVIQLEVKLNSVDFPGWPQIDAIGISSRNDLGDIQKNVLAQVIKPMNLHHESKFEGEKINIGENINSIFVETKPIISPDGKTLYFCRQRHPNNVGGKRDEGDIWYSVLTPDGNWQEAKNIGEPLNNFLINGVSSVSNDGNTLLLLNEYHQEEKIGDGISISHRTEKGWTFPEKIKINDYYNHTNFADFYLSGDGDILLMALEREDSKGDQDIYVSFLGADGLWSTPLNLGGDINTYHAEFSPFLAADNKTLFFASDGHESLGSSDIFYCKRLDDTWKNWSRPKNLGPKVNTAGFEGYYSITASGDYAYFVSASSSTNDSKDIFKIALPTEFKPEPVIFISGKVFNAKTDQPLEAKVIFETLGDGKEHVGAVSDPKDGTYTIILTKGNDYGLRASVKGFIARDEHIDASDLQEFTELKRDLYVYPIEVGQTVKLNNLFFERAKAEILPSSLPELNRLVEMLKENPTLEIELGGHSDNQGNEKANLELSEERVRVVRRYCGTQGISEKRIKVKAYGGSKPVASNATEENRKLNRRVEVTILKQ